jgi:hypothetical protein
VLETQLREACVVRCAIAILLGIVALQSLASQTPSAPEISPSISISLPPNVPSETVQIAYHLVGPFGGYGGYTEQRAGLHFYEIAASVEGKSATEVKLIVYAPGCEMETYVVALTDDTKVNREFECASAGSATLVGQIVPEDMLQDRNAELIVNYMAFWAHEFFGITDGAVAEFRMATVSPDADGMFRVDLPVFRGDVTSSSSERRASFRLMLRDSKTWNHIASLEPEAPDLQLVDHNLRIEAHYPTGIKFTAAPF